MMNRLFFALMIVGLCSWTFDKDNFQEVIDSAKNDQIKKRLIAFRELGIERAVDTINYNVEEVIAWSKTYLGTRHQMRGTTKSGIDCSGLMMVVHGKYGIKLPHSSHEQARYGNIVAVNDSLQKGDLVFFYNSYDSPNLITHSGLYLGDNTFIHASFSSGVIISSMDDKYWKPLYLFATRYKSGTP
jgi:murein DD-endopeptidase / murein LD-carboxypeptidase